MNGRDPEPHLLVIFGATGDLARRKLLPAYHQLLTHGPLEHRSVVLGIARTELDDKGFRDLAQQALMDTGLPSEQAESWCCTNLFYQCLGDESPEAFAALRERIEALEEEFELPGNRAIYLALPPSAFPGTITALGEAELNRSAGWTRLVIEKPFGRDIGSARALNQLVHRWFDETQLYRIDHYLGKETVQNLLVFRFANPVFESLWNRDRVESVRILVAEDIGVEGRAGYYEQAGVMRDMIQNHLTQLLTLVAMEVPGEFTADAIRNEKVKVLRAISPLNTADVVLGQYTAGTIDDEEVPGYATGEEVPADSRTPTFAAVRLDVATWRWQGVPFYLVTGKRLPERYTGITVSFRRPPISVFRPFDSCDICGDELEITLQPNEGFTLSFEVKKPGEPLELVRQQLDFRYAEAFEPLHDAYETLLLDVLTGDQTLFVRADEVEASWELYTPLLGRIDLPVHPYPAGSWGPEEAERLGLRLPDPTITTAEHQLP